jgi:hypothetical protein
LWWEETHSFLEQSLNNYMSPSTDQRENREFASELKFQVTLPVAEQIREWARCELLPDPNATEGFSDGYHITSLYFDTERLDVFRRNGSYGRSKYRIRRYGPSEVAFLERKLKTHGLVSKRRAAVPLEELQRLEQPEPVNGWKGHWYHKRLIARKLKPICQIGYCRTARVLMTDQGPVRLTLDTDIHTLPAQGLSFANGTPGARLSEDRVIIELKYRAPMPVLFKQMIETFALNPQPVSKYRLAVVALGFASRLAAEVSSGPSASALYA